MEKLLKESLGTQILKQIGHNSGGCISEGRSYETDQGNVFDFVKLNADEKSLTMFNGEYESLKMIAATKTVHVPNPVKVLPQPEGTGGYLIVMEHLNIKSLNKYQAQLGEELAQLHLFNENLLAREEKEQSRLGNEYEIEAVNKFGFHITTVCGILPLDNNWQSDWKEFFTRQRLEKQVDMVMNKFQDRDVKSLWSELQLKIPDLFKDIHIKPALLHGDLWGGNVGETNEGPVIFDPGTYYGHHEFELAIAGMFGGFTGAFYNAYHKLIPKQAGFKERNTLYTLFHYLNHWNHFGTCYRSQTISTFKKLLT